MIRRIIEINEEKCNGCGACAAACHEGAIEMVDGKARLMRDDYCDGLGDCLPACPAEAITFTEREAAAYNEEAVKAHLSKRSTGGCPGSRAMTLKQRSHKTVSEVRQESALAQWPCQIRLVPVQAPYFDGADLLVAADCTAYAYANIHQEFMSGRVTVTGCPKLDSVDYSEKLTEIIRQNNIRSVTVLRMEVPCCGGLEFAAEKALKNSGKHLPWQVVTFTVDGKIKE